MEVGEAERIQHLRERLQRLKEATRLGEPHTLDRVTQKRKPNESVFAMEVPCASGNKWRYFCVDKNLMAKYIVRAWNKEEVEHILHEHYRDDTCGFRLHVDVDGSLDSGCETGNSVYRDAVIKYGKMLGGACVKNLSERGNTLGGGDDDVYVQFLDASVPLGLDFASKEECVLKRVHIVVITPFLFPTLDSMRAVAEDVYSAYRELADKSTGEERCAMESILRVIDHGPLTKGMLRMPYCKGKNSSRTSAGRLYTLRLMYSCHEEKTYVAPIGQKLPLACDHFERMWISPHSGSNCENQPPSLCKRLCVSDSRPVAVHHPAVLSIISLFVNAFCDTFPYWRKFRSESRGRNFKYHTELACVGFGHPIKRTRFVINTNCSWCTRKHPIPFKECLKKCPNPTPDGGHHENNARNVPLVVCLHTHTVYNRCWSSQCDFPYQRVALKNEEQRQELRELIDEIVKQ